MRTTSGQLTVFQGYRQLQTLTGLVPQEIVEREVGQKAPVPEEYRALARTRIPTVKLCDIFNRISPDCAEALFLLPSAGQWIPADGRPEAVVPDDGRFGDFLSSGDLQ